MIKTLQPILTSIPIDQLVVVFMLVFARVGACIMLIPGIGSARLSTNIRIFFALALSFATLAFIGPDLVELAKNRSPSDLLSNLASEILVGLSLGLASHLFIWVLQFFSTSIAMVIGFSGQPGHGIVDSNPESPLTNLITIAGLMVFFSSDLHLEVLKGLMYSYKIIPATLVPRPQAALIDHIDNLSQSFLTVVRISSPFIVYSILVNFSIGILNKLTPAIPVYFISAPIVLAGGIFLTYSLIPEILNFFLEEMHAFLE